MAQSLFIQYVQKFFPGVVIKIVEKMNDIKRQPSYLHKRMLNPVLNVSGKWESLTINNQIVMADIIAMDSSLPLKSRPSISKAGGDIPKMGIALFLNEKQLTDLDTLVRLGGNNVTQINQALFSDLPKVIGGIYERNERIFLEGLSEGVSIVDSDNDGTGIRIDYGFAPANKRGVSVLWSTPATAKPITDIQNLVNVANTNGDTFTKVMMDRTAFGNLVQNPEVKSNFIFLSGVTGDGTNVPSLGEDQVKGFFRNKWGIDFEIVDRTVKYQLDKTIANKKPWADGRVVFTTSENVGDLQYSVLAEENHPVDGRTYTKADGYILTSKYRTSETSLREWTSAQARVIPVINADGIYTLDTKTVQA